MALIVRIDVDRPYGKHPVHRHLLSRVSSDFYFPKTNAFGYLKELETMLRILNERKARAYLFFRRCTLPSPTICKLIEQGRHEIGLHLENSRSYASFEAEKRMLESHVGTPVRAVSKHGSGGAKFGFYHYAPYEPERYVEWARQAGMKLLLGNLEDPSLEPQPELGGFTFFPAAFWLEPHWRDTASFTVDWLVRRAGTSDVVLLVHPENVLESSDLTDSFDRLVGVLETKIFS